MTSNQIFAEFAQLAKEFILKAQYLEKVQRTFNKFAAANPGNMTFKAVDCKAVDGRMVIVTEISFDPPAKSE